MLSSPLCPLAIAKGKPGKVGFVTGDGGNRGGIYPASGAAPMVEVVDTEVKILGVYSNASRKRESGRKKEKSCIRVLDIVGDMHA